MFLFEQLCISVPYELMSPSMFLIVLSKCAFKIKLDKSDNTRGDTTLHHRQSGLAVPPSFARYEESDFKFSFVKVKNLKAVSDQSACRL